MKVGDCYYCYTRAGAEEEGEFQPSNTAGGSGVKAQYCQLWSPTRLPAAVRSPKNCWYNRVLARPSNLQPTRGPLTRIALVAVLRPI
jgi:hypothetical protein